MLIKDILKNSLEFFDKKEIYIKNFFDSFDNDTHNFKIENVKDQLYIAIYNKKNKQKVGSCKINKVFDFIEKYNVLYWDWANINTDYYNIDVKKLWEFGFNLININKIDDNANFNKFLRIIFLNSGIIINNKLTLNLIVSLISYNLKKGIICYLYNNETEDFKLVYENPFYKQKKNKKYEYAYYYSIYDCKILKNNKLVEFQ